MMPYLTSTILILALRTTLTTITALEHFPSDKYALLPRMEMFPPPETGVGFPTNLSVP
jgi:hypothetical protein